MKRYMRRKTYTLKLSEKQLDEMGAVHTIRIATSHHNIKTEDITDLNPEWVKLMASRFKPLGLHRGIIKALEKDGVWDGGNLIIRKTRKGYVVSFIYNWRSKGIHMEFVVCDHCKKSKIVNIMGVCEKCVKLLKSKRKYTKFLYGDLR